jgi:glycosyl transferase family 25
MYTNRPWPNEIGSLHVISVTHKRRTKFVNRCVAKNIILERDIKLCDGVNGNSIKPRDYLVNGWSSSLSRGQIGCWLSHKALWIKQVQEKIPYMLIAEDDTVVINTAETRASMARAFDWLQANRRGLWDALFVTRSRLKQFNKKMVAKQLATPGEFWGLNCYLLSLQGAQKLLEDPRSNNFDLPVDVVVARMARTRNQLRSYCCVPCVFKIQKETSSTNGII